MIEEAHAPAWSFERGGVANLAWVVWTHVSTRVAHQWEQSLDKFCLTTDANRSDRMDNRLSYHQVLLSYFSVFSLYVCTHFTIYMCGKL